jgi:acetyltransferase-like isoleucine patch superfamily enzyme/acyl carrier protein
MNVVFGMLDRLRVKRWLAPCARVGVDPRLDGKPTLGGEGRIELGDRFHLASRPMQSHMVTGQGGVLSIGNDVSIAHGSALAAHLRVTIGDRTRIAPFCVIMDTDFHVAGARDAQHDSTPVDIGKDVRIGSRVTILRGATIGDGAEIKAGSVVSGVIPAGMRAGGVPAMVLGKVGEPDRVAPTGDATDVPDVVMRTFNLAARPDLASGPDQIPGWDSLGALRLVMALEDAFGLLDNDALGKVRCVGDLVGVVERAREKRAGTLTEAGSGSVMRGDA